MRRRDAAPYALARLRRLEPLRRVVRRPRALRQERDLQALDELRLLRVAAYGHQHCPARARLQSERDALRHFSAPSERAGSQHAMRVARAPFSSNSVEIGTKPSD